MALIVYGSPISPFVRKVRVVLAEKGVEYTLDPVNPFAPPPDYVEISPLKRIPALRDTDLPEPNTLADSSVISDYLERKFPTPALYPTDNYLRGRALWFEEYSDSIMAQNIGLGLFFERIVKKFMRRECDETVVTATLTEKLPPLFGYLEKEIGNRDFLVGNSFSIADISVGTMFVNFGHAGETIDTACWPNLARYVAAIHARPSFKVAVEDEHPIIKAARAA